MQSVRVTVLLPTTPRCCECKALVGEHQQRRRRSNLLGCYSQGRASFGGGLQYDQRNLVCRLPADRLLHSTH